MTCQRYDLSKWWSVFRESSYDKNIPWSNNKPFFKPWGLDPVLNDQIILRMQKILFNSTLHQINHLDEYYKEHHRPLLESYVNYKKHYRFDVLFTDSNRCERIEFIANKLKPYREKHSGTVSTEITTCKDDMVRSYYDMVRFFFCQSSNGTIFALG